RRRPAARTQAHRPPPRLAARRSPRQGAPSRLPRLQLRHRRGDGHRPTRHPAAEQEGPALARRRPPSSPRQPPRHPALPVPSPGSLPAEDAVSLLLRATPELVAEAWLKTVVGDRVATTLPKDNATWAASGFCTLVV